MSDRNLGLFIFSLATVLMVALCAGLAWSNGPASCAQACAISKKGMLSYEKKDGVESCTCDDKK
jgi:hypothetical protein